MPDVREDSAAGAPLLAIGAVLLLLAVAYAPTRHAGFIWDDDRYVTENPTLRSVEGLGRIWLDPSSNPQYYPLVHTSFWIEYQLAGLDPSVYHRTNLLLHALAVVLLWLLLLRLRIPGAAMAAGLFAVHPVMVESVAWVTERKNVLSGAFYLASLLAYLHASPLEGEAPSRGRARGFYLLSLALFLLALLSKTVTASLPVTLLLLTWWKRGIVRVRDILPLVPMFAVGAALGLFTVHLERNQVLAQGIYWDHSLLERFLIAGRAVWFYAASLVWPHPLSFIYPRWEIDASVPWQYAFPLAALLLVVALAKARPWIGRGPLAAALYFGATLFPALGFFNVYPMRFSFVADHFQYLASLGPFVLFAGAGSTLLARSRAGRRLERPLAIALLLVCAALSWRQGHAYRDAETLWRDTLAKNPGAAIAHNNLASALLERNRVDEAIASARRALALDGRLHQAHYNLGVAAQARGDLEGAVLEYRNALRLEPNYPAGHANLGAAFTGQGRLDEAERHLRRALELQPAHPDARSNLGVVLARRGKVAEARVQLETVVRQWPGHAAARRNLAALGARGDPAARPPR